jgi:DNA-binding transcriptional LysR family regulator
MDRAEIEAFLTLADELHFGRAADRLYISQSRMSRLIAGLERDIEGALFERSSRRVRLTPLGARLLDGLRPAYLQMSAAYEAARRSAREVSGPLRVGFTVSTEGPLLRRLVSVFEAANPGCQLTLSEVTWQDAYRCLRDDRVDVIFNWLVVDSADLSTSVPIDHQARVLAVAAHHPLAGEQAVSIEDIAAFDEAHMAPPIPAALDEAFAPLTTPGGREIRRRFPVRTMSEILAAVGRGQIVHPTVASIAAHIQSRDDIVLVPISDLDPMPLGLMWCASRENARIRAVAATVASLAGMRSAP